MAIDRAGKDKRLERLQQTSTGNIAGFVGRLMVGTRGRGDAAMRGKLVSRSG